MSVVKVNKKQVLQQSNCNIEVSNDKEEDVKVSERNGFQLKNGEEKLLEIENQCSPLKKPEKNVKSEARKLRSIRLDLSSLKRGVIQKANGNWRPIQNGMSSDESSEDDLKKKTEKKQKPRPEVPNYVTNTVSGPSRKPRQNKQEPLVLSSQTSPIPAPKSPQPLSIARRNARERYRVRQVNEGFTTLRNRIPDYISKAYNAEKKRKHTKKLSKVETLRMAVDYIRHLETLLDLRSTEKDVWIKQIKTESQPWSTSSSSSDYPSPAKSNYLISPGPSYEPTLVYPERIYYRYDLDFEPRKETVTTVKNSPAFMIATLIGDDNQGVDDFKIYETLNRLKKEPSDDKNEEGIQQENNIENMDVSQQEPDPDLSPKTTTDVIITVTEPPKIFKLPPIKESFTKSIPVFY